MTASTVPGSRKCHIILLDNRQLEIFVQPRMYAGDLFDLVSSHFNLKEKEFFGLYFMDDTNHPNWLLSDRRVLEHDLPRSKDTALQLYFAVRFYVESIAHIQDSITIELFYQQACQSVYQGTVECDSDTVFELAGHSLQADIGDYSEDWYQRGGMRKFTLLPTQTLREHPSMQYCEDRVVSVYRNLHGQTRGQSITNYMSIVESLPTYGIHYYEVKDKSGIPWWLGLSYKGIAQYDHADKRTPRRVFPWKQLENLYFRDKKFSIEVQDPKRVVHALSSFNLYEEALREPADECDDLSDAISHPTTQISVSRRTFGPSNVTVCAWFASKPQLTKCIWSMAVCQHQFYLDRRQSKSHLPPARSLSEIASSIPDRSEVTNMAIQARDKGPSDLFHDGLRNSLISKEKALTSRLSKVNLMSPEEQEARQKAYLIRKRQRDDLQAMLHTKLLELRAVCLQEASLIGHVPAEYPLAPGEKVPTVPRRVGTSFSIANKIKGDAASEGAELDFDGVGMQIKELELQCEIHRQITRAMEGLVNDTTLSKGVRKKHRADYQEMRAKLKAMEAQLRQVRVLHGYAPGDTASMSSGEPELRSVHSSPASVRRGLPSPTSRRQVKKVASTPQFEQFERSPGSRRRNSASSRTLASRRSVSPTLSTPLSTRSRRLSAGGTSASQPNVHRFHNADTDVLVSPSSHFATIAVSHSSTPSARRRLDVVPASSLAPLAKMEIPSADTVSLGGSSIGSAASFCAIVQPTSGTASADSGSISSLALLPPPAFAGAPAPLLSPTSRMTPPVGLLSPHTYNDSGSTSSLAQVHAYSVSSGRPLRSGSVNDVTATGEPVTAPENASSYPTDAGVAAPAYPVSHLYSSYVSSSSSSQRNKELYTNNPYGSLERKGLRARRSVRASLESPACLPPVASGASIPVISGVVRQQNAYHTDASRPSATASPGSSSRSSLSSFDERPAHALPSYPSLSERFAPLSCEAAATACADRVSIGSAASREGEQWWSGAIRSVGGRARCRAADDRGSEASSWSGASSSAYGAGSSASLHGAHKLPPTVVSVLVPDSVACEGIAESPSGSPRASAFTFDIRVHHSPSQQDISAGSFSSAGAQPVPREASPAGGSRGGVTVRRSSSQDAVASALLQLNAPRSSSGAAAPPFSPSHEESKPFEMTDYYKYSEKLRQRRAEQQQPCPAAERPGFQSAPHPTFTRPRVPSPSSSSHDGSRPSSPFAMFASFNSSASLAPSNSTRATANTAAASGLQQWASGHTGGSGPLPLREETAHCSEPADHADADGQHPSHLQGRLWDAGHRQYGHRGIGDAVPADAHMTSADRRDDNPLAWHKEREPSGNATLV